MYFGKTVDTHNYLQTKIRIFGCVYLCLQPLHFPTRILVNIKGLVMAKAHYVVSCLSVFAHAVPYAWNVHLVKPGEIRTCAYLFKHG